jgi:Flp pilus assembly protein TadD
VAAPGFLRMLLRVGAPIAALVLAHPAAAAQAGGAAALEPRIGLPPSAAALLLQGADGGALDFAAIAHPAPAGGTARRETLTLEVAGAALRPAPAADAETLAALELEVYAYVMSRAGAVLGHAGWRLAVPSAAWDERPSARGVRLVGGVEWALDGEPAAEPAPGVVLRVLVLDPASRRHGLITLPVTGGGGGGGEVALPPLRFPASGEWITLAATGWEDPGVTPRPVRHAGETISFPLDDRGGEPVAATRPGSLWEPPQASLDDRGGEPVAATLRGVELVLTRDDRVANRVAVNLREREGGAVEAVATLPGELPAGRYRVRLDSGPHRSAGHELWVLPPRAAGGPEGFASWTEVAWSVSGDVVSPRREADRGDPASGRLARRQREVLATLAERGREAAVGEQTRLIHDALDGPGLERLLRAQVAVARDLVAGADATPPEVLVPWLDLHRLGYEIGLRAGDQGAIVGHRQGAAEVAAVLAAASPSPETRRLAADALVALAAAADPTATFGPSRLLLEQALGLDPDHLAARRLLAFARERRGELRSALAALEPVGERARDDREVRLHLATLRLRTGRVEAGEAVARALLAERRRDWVEAGAAVLVATSLLERGAGREALEVIRGASSAQPEDQRLQLVHAFVLDRLGRGGEALRLLERLTVPERHVASAERRYAEPAIRTTGAGLSRLEAAMPPLTALLDAAIARRWGRP